MIGWLSVTFWVAEKIHQHAPTPGNLKVFRDGKQERVCISSPAREVDITQNSMNSHVLVHVGASDWVTNTAPKCTPIPTHVAKHHELPVFDSVCAMTLDEIA